MAREAQGGREAAALRRSRTERDPDAGSQDRARDPRGHCRRPSHHPHGPALLPRGAGGHPRGRRSVLGARSDRPGAHAALDVLLLDLDMPGQSGIDALTMIKAKAAHVGVLVLSGYPEHQYAVPLIRKGASGYLNKACEPGEIANAIRPSRRAALHHARGRRTARHAGDHAHGRRRARAALGTRTPGVPEARAGLHRGRNRRRAVASAKTVSTYRARLMRKLDARSNSDLTYYALKHRLLD